MSSIRKMTNNCIIFNFFFILSRYGLKIGALKKWNVFKAAQCKFTLPRKTAGIFFFRAELCIGSVFINRI